MTVLNSMNGGLNISKSNASMFSNERAGDILLYAGTSNQRFIMGTSNSSAIVTFTDTSVHMHRDLFCPNYIQSTGMTLTMGDPVTRQHVDLIDITGNATGDARAASNAIFGTSTVAYNAANVAVSKNETIPVTFSSNVSMLGDLDVQGTLSVHDITYQYSNVVVYSSETLRNAVAVDGPIATETSLTIGSNANPNYPLMVQRTGSNGSLSNISIYAAGAIFAGGDLYGSSDSRFKTDLRPITDALSKLDAIGGYTFRRVAEGEHAVRRAGVLAQDVEAVLPEVVSTDGDGMRHVAYGNMSALLIEAIKELKGSRHAATVVAAAADETFELPLPAPSASGRRWTHALVSAADGYGRACARVSDDGLSVVGRCETPGTYHVIAFAA